MLCHLVEYGWCFLSFVNVCVCVSMLVLVLVGLKNQMRMRQWASEQVRRGAAVCETM